MAFASEHDDLVGLTGPLAILRVSVALNYLIGADPTEADDARAAVRAGVDGALRASSTWDARELGFLARACGFAGDRDRARMLAAQILTVGPDDPDAAGAAIAALACASLFERARFDLAAAERRWPGHPALALAVREIAEFERRDRVIEATMQRRR